MAQFPSKENDVMSLAISMLSGFTVHPLDFPSVDPTALSTALGAFQNQKISQEDARSQAQIATVEKVEMLDSLVEEMKKVIKLAEIDTAANPEKLTEIGWGPKQPPQPVVPPGQPDNLRPVAEGEGTVWLQWDRPLSGGAVTDYIIQRRDASAEGQFGPWSLVTTTYNREINLSGQPTMTKLEYRVIASNAAGQSVPSNTVVVVL